MKIVSPCRASRHRRRSPSSSWERPGLHSGRARIWPPTLASMRRDRAFAALLWRTTSAHPPKWMPCWRTPPNSAPRSPSRDTRPTGAVTPATSPTSTDSSGKLPIIRRFPTSNAHDQVRHAAEHDTTQERIGRPPPPGPAPGRGDWLARCARSFDSTQTYISRFELLTRRRAVDLEADTGTWIAPHNRSGGRACFPGPGHRAPESLGQGN